MSMKTVFFFFLTIFLIPGICLPQEIKPLYSLPKIAAKKHKQKAEPEKETVRVPEKMPELKKEKKEAKNTIIATDGGIFRIVDENTIIPLWTEGKAKQILTVDVKKENNVETKNFYFVTSKGILFSENLKEFEFRNNGLPSLVIKKYDGQNTRFENQSQDLKDICANPLNPEELVTATKDKVFVTRDGGKTWKSIGSGSERTNGIKSVAIASMQFGSGEKLHNETVVFMGHSILGFFYYSLDAQKPAWKDASSGIAGGDPANSADEIADILPLIVKDEAGNLYNEIFFSQSFMPRLYHYDMRAGKSVCIYKGKQFCDTYDALTKLDSSLLFLSPEGISSFNMDTKTVTPGPDYLEEYISDFALVQDPVNAAWIPQNSKNVKSDILLNELWLLNSGNLINKYADKINGKKSLYVPAYQAHLPGGIAKFKKLILDNKLDSLVIDMKDDYGLLRYDAQDSLVTQKGVVSKYALDIDNFISEFKKDNIYLIARIVVFKDRNLSNYNNSEYAVWDKKTGRKWMGIKGTETLEDGTKQTQYYDEAWVDPFCPEVWEYNVAIAKELIERGFDEIQFDYIRFPTDGMNLYNAEFRWKSNGMDKESALISFLSYARENINAPIGIDIYGANGWYRSGTRTGQDVETLSQFVDVICPMFYPSHFENKFMNYPPYEERPYRIYYYGTYRNSVIARNRIAARPWIQTFFLNVPYDRAYYDTEYVLKEIFGVRDSVNRGYMHWNNAGNYAKLSPDPGEEPYTGKSPEAAPEIRKPAIGKKKPAVIKVKEPELSDISTTVDISVLDTVLNQDSEYGDLMDENDAYPVFTPILNTGLIQQPAGGAM